MKWFGNETIYKENTGMVYENINVSPESVRTYEQFENGLLLLNEPNGSSHYESPNGYIMRRTYTNGDYFDVDGVLCKLEGTMFLPLNGAPGISTTTAVNLSFFATHEIPSNVIAEGTAAKEGDIVETLVGPKRYYEVKKVTSTSIVAAPYGRFRHDETVVLHLNEQKLVARRKVPNMLSMADSLGNTENPRVKCSINGRTHVIPYSIRDDNRYRHFEDHFLYQPLRLNIPGFAIEHPHDFIRLNHQDWLIDMIVTDTTSPRGTINKTFYRAWSPEQAELENKIVDFLDEKFHERSRLIQPERAVSEENSVSGATNVARGTNATQNIQSATEQLLNDSVRRTYAESVNQDAAAVNRILDNLSSAPLTEEQLNSMFTTQAERENTAPAEDLIDRMERTNRRSRFTARNVENGDIPEEPIFENVQEEESIWAHHKKKL